MPEFVAGQLCCPSSFMVACWNEADLAFLEVPHVTQFSLDEESQIIQTRTTSTGGANRTVENCSNCERSASLTEACHDGDTLNICCGGSHFLRWFPDRADLTTYEEGTVTMSTKAKAWDVNATDVSTREWGFTVSDDYREYVNGVQTGGAGFACPDNVSPRDLGPGATVLGTV